MTSMPEQVKEHPTEEEIDETLAETFPASDPPSWTLGVEPTAAPQSEAAETTPKVPLRQARSHRTRRTDLPPPSSPPNA
jgi:hypothetical protein